MKQRFPSRDIWEDSPDSLQLQTTVAEPQGEDKDTLALPSAMPTTGAVSHHQEKAETSSPLGSEEGRATTGIAAPTKPTVPARPTRTKSTESPEMAHPSRPSEKSRQADGASPPPPIKAKPQIPARPSKPIARNSSETVALAKVPSDSSAKSSGSDQAVAAKPKPPVPSRPVGSKIAALQSGFMLDLNKRLQLGPQAPKKEEPAAEVVEEEKEKAPLADARKGRARGPARRAPAPATTVAAVEKPIATCGICKPSTLWQIDPDEDLLVPSHKEETATISEMKPSEPESKPIPSHETAQVSHDASDSVLLAGSSVSEASGTEEVQADESAEGTKEAVPDIISDNTPSNLDEKKAALVASEDTPESEAAGETLSTSADTAKPEAEGVEVAEEAEEVEEAVE